MMKRKNPRVEMVQELRRSSAATPHKNKTAYTRKDKHKTDWKAHA